MIRSSLLTAAVTALLLAPVCATVVRAADCAGEVEAAFEKQRTTAPGYHVEAEQYQDAGAVKISIDYALPDRMYQKILPPNERNAIETTAVARWAWGNMGGGWEELQPQFAQSVTAHVAEMLGKPIKAEGSYECLGKVTVDGRDYTGYRSTAGQATPNQGDANTPKQQVARTVYVDPATGLPAVNVIGDAKEGGKVWAKSVFTYPKDLKIDAPVGAAPAPRTR